MHNDSRLSSKSTPSRSVYDSWTAHGLSWFERVVFSFVVTQKSYLMNSNKLGCEILALNLGSIAISLTELRERSFSWAVLTKWSLLKRRHVNSLTSRSKRFSQIAGKFHNCDRQVCIALKHFCTGSSHALCRIIFSSHIMPLLFFVKSNMKNAIWRWRSSAFHSGIQARTPMIVCLNTQATKINFTNHKKCLSNINWRGDRSCRDCDELKCHLIGGH